MSSPKNLIEFQEWLNERRNHDVSSVFHDLVQIYKEALQDLNSTPPLTPERIVWGLDCNLEDPSDEESHAFEVGVRFAEFCHGHLPKD